MDFAFQEMYIDLNHVVDQLKKEIHEKFAQQYEIIYNNQNFESVQINPDQTFPNMYLVFLRVKSLLNLHDKQSNTKNITRNSTYNRIYSTLNYQDNA